MLQHMGSQAIKSSPADSLTVGTQAMLGQGSACVSSAASHARSSNLSKGTTASWSEASLPGLPGIVLVEALTLPD